MTAAPGEARAIAAGCGPDEPGSTGDDPGGAPPSHSDDSGPEDRAPRGAADDAGDAPVRRAHGSDSEDRASRGTAADLGDALSALAVDPGLGGLTLRARAGPVRSRVEAALARLPGPLHRVPPGFGDQQLFGGLDVAASLAEGRAVHGAGLAAKPALLVLPMAERMAPALAARLGQLLDDGRGHRLVLLDESAEDEAPPPAALTGRLAFRIDLSDVRAADAAPRLHAPADLDAARARLPRVAHGADDAASLVTLAARFGIDDLRSVLLALRAARALAALAGRGRVAETDLGRAGELVYPSRATRLPQEAEADCPPPPERSDGDTGEATSGGVPDDVVLAAIAARLPAHVLAGLGAGRAAAGCGAGAPRPGTRRGRPLPARPGRPGGAARIDVVATLRAAAPWQRLRSAAPGRRIAIRPADIRLKRTEDRSERLLILAVDASGSAAMARLAEAKGAVELLLGQAYARRDRVALIAFRGAVAELALPPTRALVAAKRRLAALPGGGGTPLAHALREAMALAARARGHGLDPALALLTDGRANVALDGTPGRERATEDARRLACLIAATGLPGIVIDTGRRPAPETVALAAALGARHLALPHADAGRLSRAITTALAD